MRSAGYFSRDGNWPRDYAVPNFGVDHDILGTAASLKDAEASTGKTWNFVPEDPEEPYKSLPHVDAEFKLIGLNSDPAHNSADGYYGIYNNPDQKNEKHVEYNFNPELSHEMKHSQEHFDRAKGGEWKAKPLDKPWEDDEVQVSQDVQKLVKEFKKIQTDIKGQEKKKLAKHEPETLVQTESMQT